MAKPNLFDHLSQLQKDIGFLSTKVEVYYNIRNKDKVLQEMKEYCKLQDSIDDLTANELALIEGYNQILTTEGA